MNPVGKKFLLRQSLKDSVRSFFRSRKFVEIDTPIIVACPGVEANLNFFETEWVDLQGERYPKFLRSSPELHMKMALASSRLKGIFQIAPSFRNGGEFTAWHHPEFNMLEWYECRSGFEDLIEQTLAFLRFSVEFVRAEFPHEVTYKVDDKIVRLSVDDAFAKFAGLELKDEDPLLASAAYKAGVISINPKEDDFETAFFKVLLEKIEPELKNFGVCVLYDYPPSMSILAKVVNGKAKRFEVYVNGIELCNAFNEEVGLAENLNRLKVANEKRRATGKPLLAFDEGYLEALEYGLPHCSGNALGLDRWLAILTGADSLDGVLPFDRGQFPGYPKRALGIFA